MNLDTLFEFPVLPSLDEAWYKLEYFYNERGERTINANMALNWIDKGIKTKAVLKDKEGRNFSTTQLYWITTDRAIINLQGEGNCHYAIRKSIIRVRYVKSPSFVDSDTNASISSLEKAKECLDKGHKVHAFFIESDGCKTTTANIAKIDMDEKMFKTVTNMSYYIY